MKSALGWVFVLILGLILIVVGFQGRLGSLAGSLITPSQLIDTTQSKG